MERRMMEPRELQADSAAPEAGLKIAEEHRRETLGLATPELRLSWIVETAASGWHQAAYEIEALGADGQARG
jgi:hypothetical protein